MFGVNMGSISVAYIEYYICFLLFGMNLWITWTVLRIILVAMWRVLYESTIRKFYNLPRKPFPLQEMYSMQIELACRLYILLFQLSQQHLYYLK